VRRGASGPTAYTCEYGKFKAGQTVHLYGDNVNIRNAPGEAGQVIATLPVGTPLSIVGGTVVLFELNGFRDKWYQVTFVQGGRKREGYVWGGLLARAVVDLSGPGGRFLLVMGINGKGTLDKTAEARLVRNRKIVARLEFVPIFSGINDGKEFGYCTLGAMFPARFTPPLVLVSLQFEYGACDYPNGEVVVGWDGKRLFEAFRAVRSSNEEGGVTYTIFTPGHARAGANTVLVEYMSHRNVAAKDGTNRREPFSGRSETYRWENGVFRLVAKKAWRSNYLSALFSNTVIALRSASRWEASGFSAGRAATRAPLS
jgi:hypothetical protein